MQSFWSGQLSTASFHAHDATWIKNEEKAQKFDKMHHADFGTEEIREVIKKLPNWKAPGPDQIQNFWYKKFNCVHQKLTQLINGVIYDPTKMPVFLTEGVTYLIPKDVQNTKDPAKYRPITCLPTLYKIITSCLARRLYAHCETNHIIAQQQKGCMKGSKGCKEQLIVDSVVCDQAYSNHRNLFMAYIDYQKAYDSVPHDWLIRVPRVYKVDEKLVLFLEHIMTTWRTRMKIPVQRATEIISDILPIRRGIFQGDTLSPLWFVLSINPLSSLLNSTNFGFGVKNGNKVGAVINHLLFMDDLKLYAANETQLEQLLRIVESFTNDIMMKLGLDKCRTLKVKRGKLHHGQYKLESGQQIDSMTDADIYKYLGVKQARRIDHASVKNDLKIEFAKRVRLLFKTGLNSRNLMKAINTYAIPILSYSFGVIKWSNTEIEGLERKIRTLMTKARKHHPRSAVERVTLPRYQGGRGFIDISSQRAKQIGRLREYFFGEATVSTLYKAIVKADKFTPLSLCQEHITTHACDNTEKINIWRTKPLHGRHLNEVSQAHVDKSASYSWLTSGQLFPETEGLMLAVQDQVIPTKNYLKYIVKDKAVQDDKCRYGCQSLETIQHITSACQHFAGTEYKLRHDAVAKIVHQEIVHQLRLTNDAKLPYYKYQPCSVLEDADFRVYWDRTVLTDLTVMHNRPDIIMFNKKDGEVVLIDIAIPNNNNLQAKHIEKISKYADLVEPIKRQWHVEQVRTIPIIISSTGVIPKNLFDGLRKLRLKEHIYKLMQKAVVLATTRIVRKFMCSNFGL